MNRLIPGLVLLAALAGCSSAPRAVSGTQDSVLIEYNGNDLTDATQRATTYCGTLGKHAQLQGVSQQGGHTLATFNCL